MSAAQIVRSPEEAFGYIETILGEMLSDKDRVLSVAVAGEHLCRPDQLTEKNLFQVIHLLTESTRLLAHLRENVEVLARAAGVPVRDKP